MFSAVAELGAASHRLAAGLEHGVERFDAVVRGLEKQVLHHRLRLLELLHERQGHRSALHRAAELRVDAIAGGTTQYGDGALFSGLQKVRRFVYGPAALFRGATLLFGHIAIIRVCTTVTYSLHP